MPHPEEHPKRPQGILRQESDSRNDVPECVSPSSYLGLNSRFSPPKTVCISDQPEVISPLILGEHKLVDSQYDLDQRSSPRRVPVKGLASKRLSGRLALAPSPSLKNASSDTLEGEDDGDNASLQSRHGSHRHLESLIDQVSQWIREERNKHSRKKTRGSATDGTVDGRGGSDENLQPHHRRDSNLSEPSFDLDKLEDIIKYNLSIERKSRHSRNRSPGQLRRRSSLIKTQRKQSVVSSDTDTAGYESDTFVPSCDVVLDNSQTLSYTGGVASDSNSSGDELERSTSYKDMDAWAKFKFEIVRIAHTLRLKGWRRVPMNMSNEISVERLSGALTNAVYLVTPPADLPDHDESNSRAQPRNPPPKLLLRIYGPNVDHLIDREAELAILRRLAKKKIGPSLLGTFANGRFEEYFYAKTLTPDDLRDPVTSKQIAKRMRELHDGIELLNQERDDGAFVWRNWDKWVQRVERIVFWLDCQINRLEPGAKPTGTEAWKRRGYICGMPWKHFRKTVEQYRRWLEAQYGGLRGIRKQLVFAHNDTQYGNILRLMPTGDSPLLLPANTHKQLVVIDFEYASANLPGLEFANHFTEWCYNYHDARRPHAFHASRYPTPEEQDRFIRSYVRHRPQFNIKTPVMGPTTPQQADTPSRRPTSTISDFMLDARTPSTTSLSQQTEETQRMENEDKEVSYLIQETRMWRLANTAQWVAWGIVQAKVPGMPNFDNESSGEARANGEREEGLTEEELAERAEVYRHLAEQQDGEEVDGSEKEEVEDEFDYLGYAQHRAMFFWADAIRLGFIKEQDLPEETRAKLKNVPY